MKVLIEKADVLDVIYENRQVLKINEDISLQPKGIILGDFFIALEVFPPCDWYQAKSECRNLFQSGFNWKLADSEKLLLIYQHQRNIDAHLLKLGKKALPNDVMFWCSDYHNGMGGSVLPLAFDLISGRVSVENTDKKHYALAVVSLR